MKLGDIRIQLYLQRRPVILALLAGLAVACFLLVTGLSRAYEDQRDSLGARWSSRGVADLNAKRYVTAVIDFRAALLYSREDYSYQLNLAEALIGMNHLGEASAYLLNLRDREPDDGLVNLELARIAMQQGKNDQAIRYYHDAVYAIWPKDQEFQRSTARMELIELLLRLKQEADAQSELLALEANAGGDAQLQKQIGDFFARAGDYQHALAAYIAALKSDRHDPEALTGAGEAAFILQLYAQAQRYLQAAVALNPKDAAGAERLKTTQLVLQMDPYRLPISAAAKSRLVMQAFATAGQRLQACNAPASSDIAGASVNSDLSREWTDLKPRVTERNLLRDADIIDSAMDLVFRIERSTSSDCGAPSGPDLALLLISKLHGGDS